MDKLFELILILVVVGSTLAFGGVQPLTYSLMEIVIFLVLLGLVFVQVRQAPGGKTRIHFPFWPVLFAFWVALELVPIPWSLITRLAPARSFDPGLALAPGHWARLSIYPHDTTVMLIKFLAYLSAFLLAAYFFDSRRRKSSVVLGLTLLALVEAGYGIVQYLTGWQEIFASTKLYYTSEATGTYINHNHFAGLLELATPFVLAMVFYQFQLWSEKRGHGRLASKPASSGSAGVQAIFYLFLAVILMVALICSRSRGGMVAASFSLVFIALLAQLRNAQFKRAGRVWIAGVALFLLFLAGYGVWIGLDPVLGRFEQVEQRGYLESEGRLGVWKDDLHLIRDFPVAGTGLGTFGLSYRRYQTARVGLYFDHAHSDYLELASDTGMVGAVLLFLPIWVLLGKMVGSFLNDTRRFRRSVILGCIGATLALLLHSFTDFNLQIPANALVFAVVLGIGYKAAVVERKAEREAASMPTMADAVRD